MMDRQIGIGKGSHIHDREIDVIRYDQHTNQIRDRKRMERTSTDVLELWCLLLHRTPSLGSARAAVSVSAV